MNQWYALYVFYAFTRLWHKLVTPKITWHYNSCGNLKDDTVKLRSSLSLPMALHRWMLWLDWQYIMLCVRTKLTLLELFSNLSSRTTPELLTSFWHKTWYIFFSSTVIQTVLKWIAVSSKVSTYCNIVRSALTMIHCLACNTVTKYISATVK